MSVYDANGDLAVTRQANSPYSYVSDGGYRFVVEYSSIEQYVQVSGELNALVVEYNTLTGQLFGAGLIPYVPTMDKFYYVPGSVNTYEIPDTCEDNTEGQEVSPTLSSNWGDYPVTTRVVGERAFVTVTSPAGSFVTYSFPVRYIQIAFDQVFRAGSEFKMPNGEMKAIEVTADNAEFTANLLQSLVAENGSVEAVYFSFNVDDFEGRRVLKPLIARALEITSGEFDTPVVALLNGYHTNGYKAVTTVTAEGDRITAHGWFFLGIGAMSASGWGFPVLFQC